MYPKVTFIQSYTGRFDQWFSGSGVDRITVKLEKGMDSWPSRATESWLQHCLYLDFYLQFI